MTRYKKYLKKKGFTLEQDYPTLPDYETGLEAITTSVEAAGLTVHIHYNSISFGYYITRDGNVSEPYDLDPIPGSSEFPDCFDAYGF